MKVQALTAFSLRIGERSYDAYYAIDHDSILTVTSEGYQTRGAVVTVQAPEAMAHDLLRSMVRSREG